LIIAARRFGRDTAALIRPTRRIGVFYFREPRHIPLIDRVGPGRHGRTMETRKLQIISKADAKAQGLTRYFTGKPCPHGHVAERRVDNGHCVECARERARRRYEENPDKEREGNRRYREANPDKERERFRRWREANPDKVRERKRRWREENADKERERCRRWCEENPNKKRASSARRRSAKLQRIPPWFSDADREYEQRLHLQAEFLTLFTGIPHAVDHYYPLQGRRVSGLHCATNLQILPADMNGAKKNKHPAGRGYLSAIALPADWEQLLEELRAKEFL